MNFCSLLFSHAFSPISESFGNVYCRFLLHLVLASSQGLILRVGGTHVVIQKICFRVWLQRNASSFIWNWWGRRGRSFFSSF